MRKHVSLIGLALLGFSNILSAGCVTLAAAKTNTQNQQAAPAVPKVLYPRGQNEIDSSFVLAAYYLGGYVGVNSLQTATGGVLTTRTAARPAQGSPQYAPLSWSNGFVVELAGTSAGKNGHSFALVYAYLTGNNTSNTITAPAGVNSIAPAVSTDNIGAFATQNSSTSKYNLPYYMYGLATYGRSLIANEVFSLEAVAGAHVVAVNHTLNLSYLDTTSNLTSYTLKETTAGAGPAAGLTFTWSVVDSFAFRGYLVAAAPVAANTVTQSDMRVNSIGAATYGLNTTGSQTRQSFAGLVDIDAVYSWEFDTFRMELAAGWATQQNVGLTRMGQVTTLQGSSAVNFTMNVVKAGLSFIF